MGYKVDIRLPRAGDEDPTLVVVSGDQDACEDCIDHLKIMEEDFVQEAAEQDWERDYLKPTRQVENKESNKKKDRFMVSKAPWDVSSAEAFPSLGGGGGGGASSAPQLGAQRLDVARSFPQNQQSLEGNEHPKTSWNICNIKHNHKWDMSENNIIILYHRIQCHIVLMASLINNNNHI